MLRIFSTYLFVSKKLTPEILKQISAAGFQAVEIFATRSHFDYATRQEVRAIAQALADYRLQLVSLHAPTSRDLSLNREGATPLSICEVERVRRIEAMDELKRVLDVADDLPFPRMVLHMGGSRETADPRKRDAAFSSLEHLTLHAHHAGVTICLENTPSEMGDPVYLRSFVDETRLTAVRLNFDIGHAHLAEGPEDARIAKGFEPLRDLVVSAHIHDNHGEKDEHLPPYDGTIAWPAALAILKSAPAAADLPLTLELKEKTGPEAPSLFDQLTAASKSLSRLEEDWNDAPVPAI
ncbi:MAG TPA: sugar phosphate isomerase/epimerase family protein [Verrucomicrobiae bacterium]|nr:sugar phosphate isomerase/epimerase family protein [Verrucomicrobiae bacterium]